MKLTDHAQNNILGNSRRDFCFVALIANRCRYKVKPATQKENRDLIINKEKKRGESR